MFVKRLLADDTLEEDILAVQEAKSALAASALAAGGEGVAGAAAGGNGGSKLSREDMLSFFSREVGGGRRR